MQITVRDKTLLHLLCRHNLLSTKQIQRTVFADLELTTVMRRLRKLEQAGFIVRLEMLTCRTWVLAHQIYRVTNTSSSRMSIPDTSVTLHSEDIGNTFETLGFPDPAPSISLTN